MADFEIRDQHGRVIGAGTGDREWIEQAVADLQGRDDMAKDVKVRPQLKAIDGGLKD